VQASAFVVVRASAFVVLLVVLVVLVFVENVLFPVVLLVRVSVP
jgi:hypothetical protein